jgi:purine-binding chemotaxis protein CheW
MARINRVENFMVQGTKTRLKQTEQTIDVTTFYIDDYLFGMDILLVQEINPYVDITPVPHAPFHIKGVMNLRGEIVTVIDMRRVLGLPEKEITSQHCNIIIESEGERIGLLIDSIADVIEINPHFIEPPPRLSGVDCKFIRGVYKLDKKLLMILELEQVLSI